jgi:hypothetical protein
LRKGNVPSALTRSRNDNSTRTRMQPDKPPLSSTESAALIARGDALLSRGDLTSARLFYQRAFDTFPLLSELIKGVHQFGGGSKLCSKVSVSIDVSAALRLPAIQNALTLEQGKLLGLRRHCTERSNSGNDKASAMKSRLRAQRFFTAADATALAMFRDAFARTRAREGGRFTL